MARASDSRKQICPSGKADALHSCPGRSAPCNGALLIRGAQHRSHVDKGWVPDLRHTVEETLRRVRDTKEGTITLSAAPAAARFP